MTTEGHPKFITIEQFMVDMLSFTSRQSYYDHLNDPGWPQRVFPAGRAMLVYDECLAYQQRVIDEREPPPQPVSQRSLKRHAGRPAKRA